MFGRVFDVLEFRERIPMGPMATSSQMVYNTTYHGATQMNPFKVIYGQKPPLVLSYLREVRDVEKTLTSQINILHTLKDNLVIAQNQMK